MKLNRFALPVLAFALGTSGIVLAQDAPPPPHADSAEQGGWDAPPQEFRDIQRQGFHDGIEGARKDFDHHKPSNVEDRAEYRHPHVSASGRQDYREGFRRGYEVAMNHLTAPDHR
jgi:hypothetical protein